MSVHVTKHTHKDIEVAELAVWFTCVATETEFDSTLCILGDESTCMILGQLHSPRAPLEEGSGKLLLSTLYLETLKRITITQN